MPPASQRCAPAPVHHLHALLILPPPPPPPFRGYCSHTSFVLRIALSLFVLLHCLHRRVPLLCAVVCRRCTPRPAAALWSWAAVCTWPTSTAPVLFCVFFILPPLCPAVFVGQRLRGRHLSMCAASNVTGHRTGWFAELRGPGTATYMLHKHLRHPGSGYDDLQRKALACLGASPA